jgi:hypothetical protein
MVVLLLADGEADGAGLSVNALKTQVLLGRVVGHAVSE